MRFRQRGFTLVEILVVVAIVGIILALSARLVSNNGLTGVEKTAVREIQGPPVNGQMKGPRSADLIPASLASSRKGGYLFAMVSTRSGFVLLASPRIYGLTGRRTFYVNQEGVIHQNLGDHPASADSPVFK
jgi:prepilin-type N-terminal cleavage/methylation domain-containing protein